MNEIQEVRKKVKGAEADLDRRGALVAFSEMLFVVLPFIVIAMTLGHRGELRTILFLPEWSIVSAVIVGQTIVKLASATIGRRVHKEMIGLWLSILLVCLLVPILVVLAIVLTAEKVSVTLAATQAVLFLLAATVFWTATWLGHIVEAKQATTTPSPGIRS